MFRPFPTSYHVFLTLYMPAFPFGIPMLPLDCHMTPAAPVCVGLMALAPLAGSAHSHRSLAPS
jgi:hypothetical protein